MKVRTRELSDVNNKLNHVLNAASETAIIATDKTGLITVFNYGAERMLGYSADEVVNKKTPALFHDKEEVESKGIELSSTLGRDISGFSVFTAIPDVEGSEKDNWTYISKAGKRIPVELTVTKEFDNEGNAIGYLGLASDISQHIRNQKSLKKLKERLESATRAANIGVWELDLKTLKVVWNEQMFQLSGVDSALFSKDYSSIESILYYEERQEFNELLEKLKYRIQTTHAFIEVPPPIETTFRIVRADDNKLCWMRGHAVIQCDESGLPQSILGAMHDISSLVFAKEAAEQAGRLKSQFLSTVSHELRTPLSVVSGALSLIALETNNLSSETQNVLELANRNSKRLTLLINDLLDIEKLASGNLSFKTENLPLELIVQKAIAENYGYAEQHNTTIILINKLASDVYVNVDELRFMQVMTNLLSNAAKYSPDNEVIQVKLSMIDNTAFIEVIDRGPGIPEAFKTKIFQPFSQAQSSDSRNKGGTGLGLAITKSIIEKMEGTIGFESQPDMETCFWFSLPIVTENKARENKSIPEQQIQLESYDTGRKAKILHVEDYDDFSSVITAILKNRYEIDTAGSVYEAKQKLSSHSYDILILDIALPDGSGWEVVEMASNVNTAIKTVIISNYEVTSQNAQKADSVMSKATFSHVSFVELIDELAKELK